MILSFTLSMPNIGSWNGKWSGSNKLYTRVINFGRGKKAEEKVKEILINDKSSEMFMKRCNEYEQNPPPEEWDKVGYILSLRNF